MRLASGIVKISVATGGGGYSSAPTVALSGGGGTGASAVAQMAGTVVDAVLVTNPGKDYTSAPTVSFSGGGGTGAAATATVLSYAGTNVLCFFKGRGNDLYGVDGLGRGLRWDGDTDYLEPLGITKPESAPTISVTTGGASGAVRSIAIVNGGAGYYEPPQVVFTGGGLTDGSTQHAKGRARIAGARVVGVTLDSRGGAYTSPPQISFTGGVGSGASLTVGVSGSVGQLNVSAAGTGYTLAPTAVVGGGVARIVLTTGGTNYTSVTQVNFPSINGGSAQATASISGSVISSVTVTSMWAGYTGQFGVTFSGDGTGAAGTAYLDGLTGVQATVLIDTESEAVVGAVVSNAGTGATTTPGVALLSAVASTTGGTTTVGQSASLVPVPTYSVASIQVASGGTGYMAPPAIGFRPLNGGAVALAGVSNGSITAATVLSGGEYLSPPEAVVEPVNATAIATATQPMLGKYKCCIRYLDDTVTARNGPIPSSISDFQTVPVDTQSSVFEWAWSNREAESRVDRIELWRTTADQELVLYRVAILDKVGGVLPVSYTDTLSDDDLRDPTRTSFGIMPIVMPNGQINAKRFVPPRTTCSQACVFQDRAWYTADTTGDKPNSLWHSEVDEPESAPDLYEIVIQENHGDSDYIVSLLPFGTQLLVFQSRHLYSIQYIAQPLIDASVMLLAYRGIINPRCADVYDGVAFVADSAGMYAFDGRNIDTISVPVDNYWRDGVIDMTKSDSFFVRVSPAERVVRFYYCTAEDGQHPVRALCFCIATKAWWEETYDGTRSAAVTVRMAGSAKTITAGSGAFYKQAVAGSDAGGTPYLYRTGPYPLDEGPSRTVGVLYKPSPNTLSVRTHYNGSTSPRANAIASNRGDGFVIAQGSTNASLDMSLDRSSLGDAPGYAKAYLSGRANDRSAGGDKHMAIAVAGTKTGTDPVTIYSITVDGVKE